MRKAVIFDIDGTLADCSHRLHHVRGANKNWPAFFDAMGDDAPVEAIVNLYALCAAHYQILICSGRPDNYRTQTEDWLRQHGIVYTELYMRAAGDYRADNIVKSQILDGIIADGYEPILVIDDRPSVVAMWRERGLTCLQCRDWDEPPVVATGLLTLMVGPSGAGKSTWLTSYAALELGIQNSQIISTDALRTELCGNFREQSRNEDVYAAAHAMIKARIQNGFPAVLDATNLRRTDRLVVVELARGGPVRYVVVNRPIEERRRDAGWRATLPIDLIGKHDETFRSQEREIMAGDGLPNVTVIDCRRPS